MTNAEYHADLTHMSHSMLEVFRESRRIFFKTFVEKSRPKPDPSDPMIMGSLVHNILLCDEPFDEVFLHAVSCEDRRGNKWKDAKQEADENGLICVTNKQVCTAMEMAESVKKHPIASRLLFELGGQCEEPIFWEDEDGLEFKCKPDRIILDENLDTILYVEIKTAQSSVLKEFEKTSYDWGYHRQIDLYFRGLATKYPERSLSAVFIVIGKDELYTVRTHPVSEAVIEKGYEENNEDIAALKQCYDTNDWSEPGEYDWEELQLPYYVRR